MSQFIRLLFFIILQQAISCSFLVTIKNKIELDQLYALIILVVGKYNPAFMYIWVNSFIENQVY